MFALATRVYDSLCYGHQNTNTIQHYMPLKYHCLCQIWIDICPRVIKWQKCPRPKLVFLILLHKHGYAVPVVLR